MKNSFLNRDAQRTWAHRKRLSAALCLLLGSAVSGGWVAWHAAAQIAVRNQGYVPFSDAPINYRSEDLHDPVALLQQRLNEGKAKLSYDPQFGYLKSVLKELKVPVESQTLVFSKTSFQYKKISPEHPRALYFNDDVYVGKVHDGKAIEIVSFDPVQGAIFYLLDESKVEHPAFQRAELDCTQCHIAAGTRGVPGVLLRSIYPTETGTQALNSRTSITDQESPLSERWGGWYLTGVKQPATGMANAVVQQTATSTTEPGATSVNLTRLALGTFNHASYLSDESDVVAHLVLAHQTQMHNLITLTNYRTRIALYKAAKRQNATDPNAVQLTDEDREQFQRPAEQLLRYLLFAKEASLSAESASFDTNSAFAHEFSAHAARDGHGRSLRDFDLHHRIFRYPCSYLIYSDAFDNIPEPAKGYIYHRLLAVLTGQDTSADFAALTEQDRSNILEILLATKPSLPEEWKTYAKTNHLRVHLAQSHLGQIPRG
ncbi:hypothetical protein [Granulicella paludicola]|uniref:hypothetical protein n=1 Tax=Granulicella paludicola TaxID=474951 RepID=UPI0021DF7B07|nr:hypothetical protein [Granulicella paludicola]